MDLLALNNMTEKEVESFQELLKHEVESLSSWRGLAVSSNGVFLKKHKQEQLELIRSMYSAIDIGAPSAAFKIARIQGFEEAINDDISKLNDLDIRRERLDKDLKSLNLILQQRKEGKPKEGSSILAEEIQQERADDRRE